MMHPRQETQVTITYPFCKKITTGEEKSHQSELALQT